jgi:hypothetical protein
MAHYINFFGANSRDLRQHVDYLATLARALTAWAHLDHWKPLPVESRLMYIGMILLAGTVAPRCSCSSAVR